jgi:hypothetical protein
MIIGIPKSIPESNLIDSNKTIEKRENMKNA